MAVIHVPKGNGRDFTAEELIGKQIRIEGPAPKYGKPPIGYAMSVFADGEMVNNVIKIVLTIEPTAVVEAILTLVFVNRTKWEAHAEVPPEEITLRENIEFSFSALVSEAQNGRSSMGRA
jgi:hypothetical protein